MTSLRVPFRQTYCSMRLTLGNMDSNEFDARSSIPIPIFCLDMPTGFRFGSFEYAPIPSSLQTLEASGNCSLKSLSVNAGEILQRLAGVKVQQGCNQEGSDI